MTKTLPGTDLQVYPVCLGTANFGESLPEADCIPILDRYVGLGGNFLDTANCYAKWLKDRPGNWSEQILGRWLQSRGARSRIVLSTKGGHPDFVDMSVPRINKREIDKDFAESTASLKTDYIDIYWLHRDDPTLPAGEIVELMEAMRKAGKIRYYGFSNYSARRMREALAYADEKGYAGPCGVQNRWSLARVNEPAMEDQTLVCMDGPMAALLEAEKHRLSAVSYTSMGNGVFSLWGKTGREDSLPEALRALYANPLNQRRVDALRTMAAARGVSIASLVLAWQAHKPFCAVPISATTKAARVDTMAEAAALRLSAADIAALDAGESY